MFWGKQLWRAVASAAAGSILAMVWAHPAIAATERYDYDPLGRLIRVIDEQNRVTDYVYDAAGNILKISTGGSAAGLAPSMTSISPPNIRRGESKSITIKGQNLGNGELSTSDPGLDLTGVKRSATEVSFILSVGNSVPLGTHKVTVTSVIGKAEINLLVNPLLPTLTVEPAPLALPPDNTARNFTLKLSHADGIPHTINLASSNSGVAALGTASVTIAAGQTSTQVSVTGKAAGSAILSATSLELAALSVPVYVTGEFLGLSTSFAKPLGVELQHNSVPSTIASNVASPPVGVGFGSYLLDIAPAKVTVDTHATLAINGAGIPMDASVVVQPSDGIILGAVSVSSDGKTLTVPVSIAADAVPILRNIVVAAGGQVMSWLAPDAGKLLITRSAPELISVAPFFATAGQTISITLRGRNLHGTSRVAFTPAAGIFTEMPTVNAEGTEMTLRVQIAADAASGARVITVESPGGTSSSLSTSANTFSIVNEIRQVYTPIMSGSVGVVFGNSIPQQTTQTTEAAARPVGVVVGSAAAGITPKVGLIGQSFTLTVNGSGLQAVTAINVVPSAGLTLGAPNAAPDGSTVSIPVTIATDAPLSMRNVQVLAGTSPVSFASSEDALFLVSAPAPALESVEPNVAKIGQSTAITVRGINLQGVQAIRLNPSADVSFSNVAVNAAGTELTASMNVATGAVVGARQLVVTTAGGESSINALPSNTISLGTTLGPTITPVLSPALGVQVGSATPPVSIQSVTVSSLVGVVVQDNTPPSAVASNISSQEIGVVLGSVATAITPSGFSMDSTGTLTIAGDGLEALSSIAIVPAEGITFGTPAVATGGHQATVPVTIAANAAAGARQLILTTANGDLLFADPNVNQLRIGLGAVVLDSINPILVKQGEALTLTMRGTNLKTASSILAEPADGIVFASTGLEWSTDALGEMLTIQLYASPDAALGSRVIRIVSPDAISNGAATPANTLTVIAP